MANDEEKPDATQLLAEYENCLAGYHARDAMLPNQFMAIIQTFFLFASLLFGLNFLGQVSWVHLLCVRIVVFLTGVISQGALVIDLQATASSRNALRANCEAIEKQLGSRRYWQIVNSRKKFGLERWWTVKRGAAELYVASGLALLFLWIILAIALTSLGHLKDVAAK